MSYPLCSPNVAIFITTVSTAQPRFKVSRSISFIQYTLMTVEISMGSLSVTDWLLCVPLIRVGFMKQPEAIMSEMIFV